jgi:hypothetical protein
MALPTAYRSRWNGDEQLYTVTVSIHVAAVVLKLKMIVQRCGRPPNHSSKRCSVTVVASLQDPKFVFATDASRAVAFLIVLK